MDKPWAGRGAKYRLEAREAAISELAAAHGFFSPAWGMSANPGRKVVAPCDATSTNPSVRMFREVGGQ